MSEKSESKEISAAIIGALIAGAFTILGVLITIGYIPIPPLFLNDSLPQTPSDASSLFGGTASDWTWSTNDGGWIFESRELVRLLVPSANYCIHYPNGGMEIGRMQITTNIATIYFDANGFTRASCIDTTQS